MDVHSNNNALAKLNNRIGGLLHLGPNVNTLRTSLNLGPNVITFRTVITFRHSTVTTSNDHGHGAFISKFSL